MEQQSIEAASTSDAVTFITYVQQLKKQMKSWEKQVETYKESQRILERQRFQFPQQWLHVDNIEGEWSAFNEIIKRKDSSIQTHVASLQVCIRTELINGFSYSIYFKWLFFPQVKIVAEDKVVESRTADLLSEWEKSKPVEGSIRPSDALRQLQAFETKFSRLKEERDNVAKAKEALELQVIKKKKKKKKNSFNVFNVQ